MTDSHKMPHPFEPLIEKVDSIESRVEGIEQQMKVDSEQLRANTKLTAEIHEDMRLTREIHGWIEQGRGFFKVCGWIASALKWIAALILPLAALWALLTGGKPGGGAP